MHGSAAGIGSNEQFARWRKQTGKKYGFFGVGVSLSGEAASAKVSPELRDLMTGASFLFTRETASLANVKKIGIRGPEVGFAPDGTFSMDLTDDARAQAFLREGCKTVTLTCAPHHASFYRAYGFAPVAPDAAATPEAIASTGVDLHAHVEALAGEALGRCHAIAALLDATDEACACVIGPAGAPEPDAVCPVYALRRLRASSGSAGARAAGDGPRASSAPF